MQENCKPGKRRKAGHLLHKVRIFTVAAVENMIFGRQVTEQPSSIMNINRFVKLFVPTYPPKRPFLHKCHGKSCKPNKTLLLMAAF